MVPCDIGTGQAGHLAILPDGTRSLITGCDGARLTDAEKEWFAEARPFGLILFTRNCISGPQISELIGEAREAAGFPDMPVFIDQEGGRVQRMRPPLAPDYAPSAVLGRLYGEDPEKGLRAAWLQTALIGSDLSKSGITVDCLPVLDIPLSHADPVIGDRAYGKTAADISVLAEKAVEGLKASGVLPVIKHIPGHGRALADSHKELPVVAASREELSESDFLPFRALNREVYAMTAHILYSDIDDRQPATQSALVIDEVIRTEIGYEGVLMSDDTGMEALEGDLYERGQKAIEAGCDLILHCNGTLEDRKLAGSAAVPLKGIARERCQRALDAQPLPVPMDAQAMREELDSLLKVSVS